MRSHRLAPVRFAVPLVLVLVLVSACSGGGSGQRSSTTLGFVPSASAWVYAFTPPTITRYSADATDGHLIPEGHVPSFFYVFVRDIAVARDGEVVYAIDATLNRIDVARVDARTGAIGKDGSHPVPSGGLELALDARERFLFVRTSSEIHTLAIDATTDALSDVGSVATSSSRELILEPGGRFLYQLHPFLPEVLAFGIAPSGTLTQLDADPLVAGVQNFAVDANTSMLRASHDGMTLAGASASDASVYALEASGALTRRGGISSGEASLPNDVLWSADGSSLYVLHANGVLATYAFDADTGVVGRVDADAGSAGLQNTTLDSGARRMQLGPSGARLIVTFIPSVTQHIETFALDPATGLPGLPQRFPALRTGTPNRLVVAQRDTAALRAPRFLYVAGFDGVDGRIETFEIEPSTGDLTFRDTQAMPLNPQTLITDRAHRFLYGVAQDVAGFDVDADTGLLTSMGLVHTRGPDHGVLRATVNPTGWATYAAVIPGGAGTDYAFHAYNAGLTPTLEPLGNWNASLLGVPDPSLGYTVCDTAVDPLGQTAYYTNVTSVRVYPISTANVVQPRLDASPAAGQQDFETGVFTFRANVGPLGRHAFTLSPYDAGSAGPDFVASFDIEDSGAITLAERFALVSEPEDIALHPNGRFVYVGLRNGTLQSFDVDPDTGDLTTIETVARPARASDSQYLAMDPSGRFLYMSTSTGIERWTIDPATGALSDQTTAATPAVRGPVLVTGRFE